VSDDTRHSRAEEPEQITDPQLVAEAEARNGLRQFDLGIEIVKDALDKIENGNAWKLRVSAILSLQREALNGLSIYAGLTRPGPVSISHSAHQPPDNHLVQGLLEEMCDYVNDNWTASTPVHVGAYLMWRLNWIHPFADGNGRTSRIVSYVAMSVRSGVVLPGSPTIPDYIVGHKKPYYDALDAADQAYREGRIDVSAMEALLGSLLAKQLAAFYETAVGAPPPIVPAGA